MYDMFRNMRAEAVCAVNDSNPTQAQANVGYASSSSLIPSPACIYTGRKDVVLARRNAGGFSIITGEKL